MCAYETERKHVEGNSFLGVSSVQLWFKLCLLLWHVSSNQNEFPSTVMTRSGMSLEELRIVEGQGQSSEVITPSEELNRINDIGTAADFQVNFDLSQKEKCT